MADEIEMIIAFVVVVFLIPYVVMAIVTRNYEAQLVFAFVSLMLMVFGAASGKLLIAILGCIIAIILMAYYFFFGEKREGIKPPAKAEL